MGTFRRFRLKSTGFSACRPPSPSPTLPARSSSPRFSVPPQSGQGPTWQKRTSRTWFFRRKPCGVPLHPASMELPSQPQRPFPADLASAARARSLSPRGCPPTSNQPLVQLCCRRGPTARGAFTVRPRRPQECPVMGHCSAHCSISNPENKAWHLEQILVYKYWGESGEQISE